MENWKEIKGYKYKYFVSDTGLVKNSFDKIFNPCIDKDGYLRIRFVTLEGKRQFKMVHRLVGEYFVKGYDSKLTINHKDGNKQNNNYLNLEWLSFGDNNRHAYLTGLKNNKGENNGNAKFKEKQILEIRRLYNTKLYTQESLANMFNTKQARISEIVNNKFWK